MGNRQAKLRSKNPPPSSSDDDKDTTTKSKSKPTTTRRAAKQPRRKKATPTYRESVLDITGKPINDHAPNQPNQATSTIMNRPRMKDIFAAPVKIIDNYIFPIYDKSNIDRTFIEHAVKDNFIFSNIDNSSSSSSPSAQLSNLIDAFEVTYPTINEIIIKEGEVGDYFYILQNGQVHFTIKGQFVGDATDGASFGDLALLYDSPRAATCIVKSERTKLWRVERNAFRQIIVNSTLNKDKAILDTLKKVPFLKELSIDVLNKIANSVEMKSFTNGTKIINKGDVGLEFFVIKSGQVQVQNIVVGGETYDDHIIEAGGYFGERAIVKAEPRAADIVAMTDVVTLTLSRDKFLEVVGPLEKLMQKNNDLIALKGIPAFARSDVRDAEYKALISRIQYKTVKAGQSFYKKEESSGSGIYFLSSGKVMVEKKEITQGGYFGVTDTLFSDNNLDDATAVETCEVGYISKEALIAVIVQIDRIEEGSKRKPLRRSSTLYEGVVNLENLKKHRILGVGTFGKVWLVTNGDSKEAYALKIQQKRNLIQHSQVEGVLREMNVMAKLDHPFVLKLVNVYQNSEQVLLLVKLIQGGELYGIMKRAKRNIIPERDAKFYASGILEGLSYMHSYNILYRDLKPENVLINKDGYPVIVDLGFAKEVEEKTFTLCGTPWYIAPEVVLGRGHYKACDHWSWAILIHEMVTSETPFGDHGADQMTLFKAIVKGNYRMSKKCPKDVSDLIKRVLVTNPSRRLGSLAGGDMDLKQHPWLVDVDFDKLRKMRFKSPWRPNITDATDVSDFDNWDHMAKEERLTPIKSSEQAQFSEVDSISKMLKSRQ